MRRILILIGTAVVGCGLALAETWTGKLVDVACTDREKNAACTPTPLTRSFGLKVSGKVWRLDAGGNKKAAEALRRSSDTANREKNPNSIEEGVTATITGVPVAAQIRVDSIQIY